MRADPGHLGALALALLLARPEAACSQGLSGYAQSQYQAFEQTTTAADGTATKQRVERWVQTLELQHMAIPRGDLRVLSSFRITDLAYRGLPDQSRSPQGSIQVSHPWASLFAAYRPTRVTGGLGPAGVAAVTDTNRTQVLTARSQEAVLTGQIAPPAWPRLDLAWTRRHRDRDPISQEELGVTRLARMSWNNERLNLYGSLGDQFTERARVRTNGTQRTASAGGALRLVPMPNGNVDLNYDLSDARVGDPARNSGSSRAHNAGVNAGWRLGSLQAWAGSWLWRRNEARGPQRLTTEDHEGSLQYSLDPNGPLRMFAAGSARTLRASGRRVFAKSASAVASLDGRVRRDWTGVASLTHVTNWEPGRPHWSVEAARVASTMKFARGLECVADGQVSTTDDTTSRDVRTTTEGNLRARLSPWRAFTAGFNGRLSRTGEGVTSGASARTAGWDVRWRPVRTLELTGITARTVGSRGARNDTRSLSARWAVHTNLQLMADWSRSSDQHATAGTQLVSGREIASVHVLALLTRKLQLDATAGAADRGGPRENRQATATLTWAFGR